MLKKIGSQTVNFEKPPSIISTASIAGRKEGEGPLGDCFDIVLSDDLHGQKSWELAEIKIAEDAMKKAVQKTDLTMEDMDYIICGDLLNQCGSSSFAAHSLKRPFFGIFGACSTFGEALSLGAMLLEGGFGKYILAAAGSHFCAAEKQFRFPLDLGTQRPLSSTWTVTGTGAAVISRCGDGPFIKQVTTGKVVDLGVKDMSNMGAAMAPAAADTLLAHFKDTGKSPEYYDVIATGDLGFVGRELLKELCAKEGILLGANLFDCGIMIFDRKKQDTHSGGSGCACSALTFSGHFYKKLCTDEIKKMLFIPTGALINTTSSGQGMSIPGIAHALCIESR